MNGLELKEKLNIAIIGGGNVGTQFACLCASKGHKVSICSSKANEFSNTLEMVDEYGNITVGSIYAVSPDVGRVIKDCDLVFVTYPAFHLQMLANEMLPFVHEGMVICVLPGTGGAEFAFMECIKSGAILCGLQRVPSVARLEKCGKRVRVEGLREKLHLASIPCELAGKLSELVSGIVGIPCVSLPNYLSVTLTPSNPILHTTRLKTLFLNYEEGMVYDKNPLFYGEWDDASSKLLLDCDEEVQRICAKISKLDLTNVRSLKLHYESETVEELTKKMCSIKSLHNLKSPMKQVEEGWIPDFSSRYFTADFPFGLDILKEFAEVLHVDVPNITQTMDWYKKVTGDESQLSIKEFGILTVEDIYELY